MDKAMKSRIQAVASTPENVLMGAQSVMQHAAERAQAVAASLGVPIYVRTSAGLDDGTHLWPTTLAGTLCESPGLAQGTREDMAGLLTEVMGLSKPFPPTRLSRSLSAEAKRYVVRVFAPYGYNGAGLINGISIRDAVRRGTSPQDVCEIKREISTKFYADRVVLDGVTFHYRQRERLATGNAWNDLALRLTVNACGTDVPLLYLLKMRGISLGEFISADETARGLAMPDELVRRAGLDRPMGTNQRTGTFMAYIDRVAAQAEANSVHIRQNSALRKVIVSPARSV